MDNNFHFAFFMIAKTFISLSAGLFALTSLVSCSSGSDSDGNDSPLTGNVPNSLNFLTLTLRNDAGQVASIFLESESSGAVSTTDFGTFTYTGTGTDTEFFEGSVEGTYVYDTVNEDRGLVRLNFGMPTGSGSVPTATTFFTPGLTTTINMDFTSTALGGRSFDTVPGVVTGGFGQDKVFAVETRVDGNFLPVRYRGFPENRPVDLPVFSEQMPSSLNGYTFVFATGDTLVVPTALKPDGTRDNVGNVIGGIMFTEDPITDPSLITGTFASIDTLGPASTLATFNERQLGATGTYSYIRDENGNDSAALILSGLGTLRLAFAGGIQQGVGNATFQSGALNNVQYFEYNATQIAPGIRRVGQ